MRQVVLDTETTGLEPSEGHRVIEIGAVELVDRRLTGRRFHRYLNPEREVDAGALQVHGLSNEFLADKPRFQDVVAEFMAFIEGAQLIIHNAPFDVGFLNHELRLLEDNPWGSLEDHCADILDTLHLARRLHPGQKNSLDALCARYEVDNSGRELHGALLDAELLAEVYLRMTGGQAALGLGEVQEVVEVAPVSDGLEIRRLAAQRPSLRVIRASDAERTAHEAYLERIAEVGGRCLWREMERAAD